MNVEIAHDVHARVVYVPATCSIYKVFKECVAANADIFKVLVYRIKSKFEFKGLRKLPVNESYYSFVAACKFKVENSEERSTKLCLSRPKRITRSAFPAPWLPGISQR